MTARFRKKAHKWRGRTSHGWGMKKKHRGGGSLGGRGASGTKHKLHLGIAKDFDHDRKGFFSPRKSVKAINVGDLDKMDGNNFDLTSMGYSKLLSRGPVSKKLAIKVGKWTDKAKQKVEKAGGAVTQ